MTSLLAVEIWVVAFSVFLLGVSAWERSRLGREQSRRDNKEPVMFEH